MNTVYSIVGGHLSMRTVAADHAPAPGEVVLPGAEHSRDTVIAALPEAALAYARAERAPLVRAALTALEATDGVALRCFKAGRSFPASWVSYVRALRAIASGADRLSLGLPEPPPYPQDT